ncbi:MAG TPA: hypothetical protein PKC21_07810 [Oligoflexia bacterium]|nr:hypothetical protein [Oligoflexia bacterium]HMR25243.1 hypothetical protein [Oligoflexia bacterium]
MQMIFTTLMVSLFRILPHAPNFTPVGALAILNGRTQPKKQAFLSIVVAMVVSDFLLAQIYGYAFLSSISLFIYLAFIVQAAIGATFKNVKFGIVLSALLGALSFFFISNFAVWATSGMYSKNLPGLIACYKSALPFFRMTLISNLLWTPVLVMGHALAKKHLFLKKSLSSVKN